MQLQGEAFLFHEKSVSIKNSLTHSTCPINSNALKSIFHFLEWERSLGAALGSSEVHGQRGGDQAGPLPSTDSRHGILGPGTAAKHIPSPSGWPRVPAQRLGPSDRGTPRPPTPPSRKARNTSPTPERKSRKGRGLLPQCFSTTGRTHCPGSAGGTGGTTGRCALARRRNVARGLSAQ